MKILIRADGGDGIGFGHIMRTLTLAKALSLKNEVIYICSGYDKYIKGIEKIKAAGFNVFTLEKEDEIDVITGLNSKIIIVDKYDIDDKYLEILSKKFKVIYIDDNADLNYYPVSMIINQNPYSEGFKYNTKNETVVLTGCNYSILREEFLNENPISIKKEIEDVLITVGGSDDNNITDKILSEILPINLNYHVIIGGAFRYEEALKEKYKKNKNVKFYKNAIISNLMKKVDLAIAACGSTLYELSYLGIPTIGIIVADNQKLLGEFMNSKEKIKLCKLGDIYKELNGITYEHRLILSNAMKNLIDGNGVLRLVEEIEKLGE